MIKLNVFIVVFLGLLSFTNCSIPANSQEEVSAKKQSLTKDTIPVSIIEVKLGSFAQELVANGKIVAAQKALVPFKVQAQINKVYVCDGQKVNKGQLLAEIDAFENKKQLADSRAAFEKTTIELEDYLMGHGYSLKDTAAIPSHVFKIAKIRSGYNQALNNLCQAKHNYQNTFVRAPFAGRVANLEAQEQNPSSQYKKCCELLNDAVMRIEFSVLEKELTQVKKQQEVEVFPFAGWGESFFGKIATINPSIDLNGMVKVTALVNNTKGELIDGMNAKIKVRNIKKDQLVIPKSALLFRQNRHVVFVYEDGLAKWVYVEVGEENSTHLTITDNSLKPGQQVIINNNLNLAHETPVVVR